MKIIAEYVAATFLLICFTSQCVFAADTPVPVVKYRLERTDSLDAHGVMVALFNESAESTDDRKGRSYEWRFFKIAKVGAKALTVDCGGSEGDDLPIGSKVESKSYIGTTLTERNEAIEVINARWDIQARVSLPDFAGSSSGLNGLTPQQLTGLVKVEARGTFADHNLILTLRTKDRAYSFKLTSGPVPVWEPLPKPLDAAKSNATLSLGDQMRVEFCGQKMIGEKGNGYLVTLFVEEPRMDNKGRNKAFYYFVSNVNNGEQLRYLDCRVTTDEKPVASGWDKNDPGASPEVTNSGPTHWIDKLSLKIGSEVSQYDLKSNADTILRNRSLARQDPSIKPSSIDDPPDYEWDKVDSSSRHRAVK